MGMLVLDLMRAMRKKNVFCMANFFVFFFASAALVMAYIMEYFMNVKPCYLCLLQRLGYFIAIFFSVLGIVSSYAKNKHRFCKILFIFSILSLLFVFFISIYNVLLEKHLLPDVFISKCAVGTNYSNNIEEELALLMEQDFVSCDIPGMVIFNISLAGWNFIYVLCVMALIYFMCFFRPTVRKAS